VFMNLSPLQVTYLKHQIESSSLCKGIKVTHEHFVTPNEVLGASCVVIYCKKKK